MTREEFAYFLLGTAASGFGISLIGWGRQWRKQRRRATALAIEFEGTDAPPFLVEEYDEGKSWRCYRVGLSNADSDTLDHGRIVVERIETRHDTFYPERRLRQSNDHSSSTSVLSSAFAQPVMFDLVEQWNQWQNDNPSDWAFICYADEEPKGVISLPFGKTKVVLRAEADGAHPHRVALLLQTRTPYGETLGGPVDVRRTHVLVRKLNR